MILSLLSFTSALNTAFRLAPSPIPEGTLVLRFEPYLTFFYRILFGFAKSFNRIDMFELEWPRPGICDISVAFPLDLAVSTSDILLLSTVLPF